MENKPYYCPDCRSNRFKFSLITSFKMSFVKDAVTGEIADMKEPVEIRLPEPVIECGVCGFSGNEMRFIKQAEKEPRTPAPVR